MFVFELLAFSCRQKLSKIAQNLPPNFVQYLNNSGDMKYQIVQSQRFIFRIPSCHEMLRKLKKCENKANTFFPTWRSLDLDDVFKRKTWYFREQYTKRFMTAVFLKYTKWTKRFAWLPIFFK